MDKSYKSAGDDSKQTQVLEHGKLTIEWIAQSTQTDLSKTEQGLVASINYTLSLQSNANAILNENSDLEKPLKFVVG